MYEARLKELNPGVTNITYDVADLFAYIDSLTDLSMLVYVACCSPQLTQLTRLPAA